jgi:CPA1 family monovalent cation:H+ antiporter
VSCFPPRYHHRHALSGELEVARRTGIRRSHRRDRPVSVIATFKEAKADGRLLVLIEAESLLNDGTAAVTFGIVVALAVGQQFTSLEITAMLLKTIGGGILCGAAVALGALLLAGRTDDPLVEITFTTVAAYGSFLLADHFGLSGVLATITAGLVMGNFEALGTISDRGKEAVQAFWEYAAFVANSLVFLLIGIHEAHQTFVAIWLPAVMAIGLVMLGRAIAIYPCCLLFSRSALRITMKHQHVLFWVACEGRSRLPSPLDFHPKSRSARRSLRLASPSLPSLFLFRV